MRCPELRAVQRGGPSFALASARIKAVTQVCDWQPLLRTDSQQSVPDALCRWKQSGCICLAEFHCNVDFVLWHIYDITPLY